jgi:hypothetical protein
MNRAEEPFVETEASACHAVKSRAGGDGGMPTWRATPSRRAIGVTAGIWPGPVIADCTLAHPFPPFRAAHAQNCGPGEATAG